MYCNHSAGLRTHVRVLWFATFLASMIVIAGCDSTAGLTPPADQSSNPGTLPSEVDEPDDGDEPGTPEDNDSPGNRAPIANAGADQTVLGGEEVTLSGSTSSDPDGDDLSFEWTVNDEWTVTFDDQVAIVKLTAPDVVVDTVMVFTLRVSDGVAEAQDTVNVLVRVNTELSGVAPEANAGVDQSVAAGAMVTLSGTATAEDQGGELAFEWFQTAGTPVTLNGATSNIITFVAPSGLQNSQLVFELTVYQGDRSDVDEVTVNVAASIEAPPVEPPPPTPPDPTDNCPADPAKTEPGVCGCGVPDTDSDGDGTANCVDGCPNDPSKVVAGSCGCGVAQTDSDGDGTANCVDACPTNAPKIAPGICGCGVADTDSDSDGTANCIDGCPSNPAKIAPGVCGCLVADTNSDGDSAPNCVDGCPNDANKTSPGQCGCGVADTDSDGDTVANCIDGCPLDPSTSDAADCAATPGGSAQTDWDLVMLRLVNRARLDPAGEAARLGSSVMDSRVPVPPLAYDRATGLAATNHNTWMHLNLGNIASGNAPDSFTHYETVNGAATGAAATSSPGYTGSTLGARMTAAAMSWGSVGENILTSYSGSTIAITEAKMISNHRGWWDSSGHRNNMLSANFTSFGHKVESRAFAPPRGGLNAPVDNIMFATQNFARPLSNPRNHVFGLLYEDVDGNNGWTPRNVGDANREGLAGVPFTVRVAGTATVVATETTMDNGAFSARVADGTYDVRFTGSSLPGGVFTVFAVTVAGANVDVGDWEIGP